MRITAGMSCRLQKGAFDRPRQVAMACAVIALCAQAPFANAQPAGPGNPQPAVPPGVPVPPPITPIARPTLPGEIPLYPQAAKAKTEEQWENLGVGRIVRNVVTPTLTPVLPDPAKATGAAVIVAPGGAWVYLGMDTEGFNVAHRLADRGIAAFVLKYRTAPTDRDPTKFFQNAYKSISVLMQDRIAGTHNAKFEGVPQAIEDAGAAVRLVRSRASEWGADPKRVGFLGFSAGAATGVDLALLPDAASRPDFVGSIYGTPDVGPIPDYAPPLFAATAMDDPLFDVTKGGLLPSWAQAKRPVEAHIYERGGHGFSSGTSGKLWFDEFYAWLESRGELARKR
jgi:acetyl esterase/lipase